MLEEERNYHFHEIRATIHAVLQEILAMVVAPNVPSYSSNSEELLKVLQADGARSTLRDSKAMGHLVAGLVAASAFPGWLPDEADWEAPFSVYKTNNPASLTSLSCWFSAPSGLSLNIAAKLWRVPDGYTGFSSI
jgi:hypothetical protein